MPRLARSLFAVALWLVTLPAWGEQHRIALVQGDAELLRALSLALSAWDVATIAVDEGKPASSQPEAMRQAAELATRLQVEGVVWTSAAPEGSLLWVYAARSGQITTRVLSEQPPFSSAAAAGVALTVKTVLRASVEPPPKAPAPIPPPPPAPRPPSVSLRAGLDAQLVAARVTRAWFSLGSVAWLGTRRRVGAGLRLGAGPELAIEHPRFTGHFRELSFGPTAEFRFPASRRLVVSAFVAGIAHASFLDGTLSRDGAHAEAKRYTVSIDAGGQIDVGVGGGLFAGIDAQTAYSLGYKRYLVEGQPVFAPWRLIPAAGAHLGLELP